MKSKISFFNKTIFLKNLTLYWPIWGVYTLVLLFSQPFILWLNFYDRFYMGTLSAETKLNYLIDALYMEYYIWIIALMAIITGMAVFSYLYNGRTANMIHSLPVDRNQLFGTNVISGLAFLMVPQVFTFIVSVLVCIGAGMVHVEYLGIWLLVCFGLDFIAFGVVTFCAFFTGQLVTMPIYVIIVNCLSYLVYGVISLVIEVFAYGVSGDVINMEWVYWTSPFFRLYGHLNFSTVYSPQTANVEGYEFLGLFYLLAYIIISVGLYVVAYLVYKKRQIEQAGDLITVSWVKPIFRWGVGTSAAFLGSVFFKAVFDETGMPIGVFTFSILLLFIGMVFYFVADMFVKKSFKVFNKKGWKSWGIFSVLLLLSFGALYGYSLYSENYIPDQEDIKTASIRYGYNCNFSGEQIEQVISIHEEIVEKKELFRDWNYWDGDYDYVAINYTLVNGREISRWYQIPYTQEGSSIYQTIYEIELDPHNFLANQIAPFYEEIDSFVNGSVGYPKNEDWEWTSIELDNSDCELLYEAIIADAKAGNLQRHNMNYYYTDMYRSVDILPEDEYYEVSAYSADIYMTFYVPDDIAKRIIKENPEYEDSWEYGTWFYDEETGIECYYQIYGGRLQSDLSIQFGKNCTNIINALIEMDFIESADEIFWQTEK